MRLIGILATSLLATAASAAALKGDLPCPTKVVVISCPVIPGHYVEEMKKEGVDVLPTKEWVDMDWDIKHAELHCRREEVLLDDAALYAKGGVLATLPLNHNFADRSQCSQVAMDFSPKYAQEHPGYWPFAIACPTPVVNRYTDENGKQHEQIIDYQMPGCPDEALNGIKVTCEVDTAI